MPLQSFQDKYQSPFIKGYIKVNGYYLPTKYQQLQQDIENLEVDERDVWVCTFPRSGTTWAQEMIWMILHNLDFTGTKERVFSRCPFLELSAWYDYSHVLKEEPNYEPSPSFKDSIGKYKELKRPGCVKTHLGYENLPKEIRNGVKKPKIIYVSRDPKDVCISYYYFSVANEGFIGTFDEFCQMFLDGTVTFGPQWDHVSGYWNHKNNLNILFLQYEEMKNNLSGVIQKVSTFLEHVLTDDQVKSLTDFLTFETMKKNFDEAHTASKPEKTMKFFNSNKTMPFMRKGIVGDYKSVMSSEFIKKFNEKSKSYLDSNL